MSTPQNTPNQNWRSQHLQSLSNYILPEEYSPSGNVKWGRLICSWHEKRPDQKNLVHTYAACIDCQEWGLYLDNSPRKIFVTCAYQILARPIHTLIKTAYRLSMIPIFQEISKTCQGQQTKQQALKHSLKSLADIVLTPLFDLIITVASIAAMALACYQPKSLYDSRRVIGKIEQLANGGQIHTAWTVNKCFQPFPIEFIGTYADKDCSHDTSYPSDDPLERQLANFARSTIRHKQKNFDLISCYQLERGTAYTSPILVIENPSALNGFRVNI